MHSREVDKWRPARILVVEDQENIRRLIAGFLISEQKFTHVVCVADGAQAWERLAEVAGTPLGFELIVSDNVMPGVTGLDLLARVRADSRLRHLPFIMMTAHSEEEHVTAAIAAGVTTILTKPFSAEDLLARIIDTLQKVRAA